MKHVSLLIALLVFLGVAVQAQSTTTVEKNSKRITITTTKMDATGKPVTETWIAEGDQPETILQNMAVNPEIMEKVQSDQQATKAEGERLFMFRHAGDNTSVIGTLDELSTEENHLDKLNEEVTIYTNGKDNEKHNYVVTRWYNEDAANSNGYNHSPQTNCAALGVYVNPAGEQAGCYINALIDKGGAMEAGMVRGDVIIKLDDYKISDFPSLFEALTHYLPGDDANVLYLREGKQLKANVQLKSWADMPGQEWRARGDCGKVEDFKEPDVEPILEDNPNGPSGIQTLTLQDATMYPNPTEGNFAFSFTTNPGPLNISISDINGKVVYTEESENATGYYNKDINLKNVPSGNYVISVKQGGKVFTQQISKL